MSKKDDDDRGQSIFSIDGSTSDAELAARVRAMSSVILTSAEVQVAEVEANFADSVTFYFEPYPRIVYCNLTAMILTVWQERDYEGRYKFTFNQDCNSRKGDRVKGSDWTFSCDFLSASKSFLASISLGGWTHGCGKRDVDLSGNWHYNNTPNIPQNARFATLHWTHANEVSGC
ncbi:hypothetical protein HFO91_30420 [Rhizobium leguminosarum]|uniref:hypothetical protein n=1 Tax=Rhizobium leguminosarum TaxID=384 RepID=UPI001C96D7F1|nr:hypothetical protein [Rhizobium leguminosarum]MBY5453895.1 hypothetical protein [Rhizobium leguminosarum]